MQKDAEQAAGSQVQREALLVPEASPAAATPQSPVLIEIDAHVPAEAIGRMAPEYPPLFVGADRTAVTGERRSVLVTQFDILLILAAAFITGAATWAGGTTALGKTLSTLAAVFFLITWIEKSLIGRLGFTREWFDGRAIAETTKSIAWRYMMRAAPFDTTDADRHFVAALRDTIHSHDDVDLTRQAKRLNDDQITPYMRLVRALPADERKRCYLKQRLDDQLTYYDMKCKEHGAAAKRWQRIGQVFRGTTFLLAVLRFMLAEAALLVGLFASLTVVVAAWSQLVRYDELTKGYSQTARALRKLRKDLLQAEGEQAVEKVVLEAEGVLSHEQTMWTLKRT